METKSAVISDAYNAQSAICEDDNADNSAKLFPSLVAKEALSEEEPPDSLPTIEEDEDAPPRRVQPPRQAKPEEGALSEDWLHEHLKANYPDVKPWRGLELFTEYTLRETFPEADITAQATEIPGIRPDLVMRHNGRTVVLDAKHFNAGNIRKRADVDKLLSDMDDYGASSGVLVVSDERRVSESLRRYCEKNGVTVVEANRNLADNLRKTIASGVARRPSIALGPLKKDGTPDMRFKANYNRRGSNAEASGPLKKDGTPDMRFKANYNRRDSNAESFGPLKKDGTPDMRYIVNHVRRNSKTEALGPLKKDGTADMRFKTNNVRKDSSSEALEPLKKDELRFKANHDRRNSEAVGPLKKDGTPDMRFKVNYDRLTANGKSLRRGDFVPEFLPSITNRYAGPLKKDGTPDMRYKANYELPSMNYNTHSRGSYPGFSGSQYYSYNGNSSGPLTKAGLPDMRYKANRY